MTPLEALTRGIHISDDEATELGKAFAQNLVNGMPCITRMDEIKRLVIYRRAVAAHFYSEDIDASLREPTDNAE